MTPLLQILGGLAIIAGLLIIQALALYLIARLVLIAVSFVPLVGKRHRHSRWDSLNGARFGAPLDDGPESK
jgi:hypothetical protein